MLDQIREIFETTTCPNTKAKLGRLLGIDEFKPWQPNGGNWYILGDGRVNPSTVKKYGHTYFGHARDSQELAERAATDYRKFHRVHTWLTEKNIPFVTHITDDLTFTFDVDDAVRKELIAAATVIL